MNINWDGIIDTVQTLMIFILIGVVAVCILSLILFDVLAGAGVMMYLTNSDVKSSFFISLATSGLLLALMFIGYTMINGKGKTKVSVGAVILLLAFGVYCLDVYFDSLTADYLRFGQIVALKSLPSGDVQLLFRCLIGGISTVGESLAVAIILGMPVLKTVISDALPKNYRHTQSQSKFPFKGKNRSPVSKVFHLDEKTLQTIRKSRAK